MFETHRVNTATGTFAGQLPGAAPSRYATVPPLAYRDNQAMKRLVEAPIALLAIIALLPVMALVALVVKLTSPGPVIHRRRVLGRGGVQFDAYKFRTMVPKADEWIRSNAQLYSQFQAKHKLADDPRVTPVGRILRKLSLDELPQLFNVLKGQMSLVGPRMIAPDELTKYGLYGGRLLTVKPGLTGLWQVSGRQSTTYDRRVELDMQYIDEWTVGLDLAILARTPFAVVGGKGAM